MFTVNFWKFNKQGNSTKVPTVAGTSFDCVILRGSSVVNPTLEMDLGVSTTPDFNYCYIADFNRYYFINEWTFNNRLWTANLEVDVLATYKTEIGSANLYALRTSNNTLYDGRITDNLYPTKVNCTFQKVESEESGFLWTRLLQDGCFIIGATSKENEFGSNRYFIIGTEFMEKIITYLLSDGPNGLFNIGNGWDLDDAAFELQKSLIDPIQFIKSCIYLPIPKSQLEGRFQEVAPITIFNWDVLDPSDGTQLGCHIISQGEAWLYKYRTYTIPKHPQALTRGEFANQSPYSIYTLNIPPFGNIELDTTVLCNASTVNATILIDPINGLGILRLTANGILLNEIESQVGIPIQLSQITRDYIGAATSIIGGVAGGIGSILTGNIGGAIMGAVSGIGNAVQSLAPRSSTIGSGGTFVQLEPIDYLYAQFFELVQDDIEKNGRPCCKIVNCSAGGYFLIQDGDVPISGTKAEWEMIKSSLESGFYWE